MLKPEMKAPELEVETLGEGTWRLTEQEPEHFTMIVFYRGLHCPICRHHLRELDRVMPDFRSRGVEVMAVSGDDRERAERTREEWRLQSVPLGYGQSVESMREWGLFVSHSIKDGEPALFGEPGLFLVRPDGTVYYEAVQSMPFGRPSFADVLGAIDFVLKNNYPARGAA